MDCGVYVFISKCFPKKSAADQLGEVFSAVVYSPGIALTAICILYVIILFLMMPYYAISNIITVPGAWILFGFSVVMLCRFVARCMMFPGALLPVQKDLAKEMIRGGIAIAFYKFLFMYFLFGISQALPFKFQTLEKWFKILPSDSI